MRRDLDLTETAVRVWVRQAEVDSGQRSGLTTSGRGELARPSFDGDTLHIIEAKGGDSAYAMRTSPDPDIPGLSQTDPDYPRVVGSEMLESSKTDGRNTIGRIIGRAYDQDSVRYVGIRTGPASALRAGSPTTVVDGVFLEP